HADPLSEEGAGLGYSGHQCWQADGERPLDEPGQLRAGKLGQAEFVGVDGNRRGFDHDPPPRSLRSPARALPGCLAPPPIVSAPCEDTTRALGKEPAIGRPSVVLARFCAAAYLHFAKMPKANPPAAPLC